jgi:hypothetical protein
MRVVRISPLRVTPTGATNPLQSRPAVTVTPYVTGGAVVLEVIDVLDVELVELVLGAEDSVELVGEVDSVLEVGSVELVLGG